MSGGSPGGGEGTNRVQPCAGTATLELNSDSLINNNPVVRGTAYLLSGNSFLNTSEKECLPLKLRAELEEAGHFLLQTGSRLILDMKEELRRTGKI
ncbi:hypothetical protein [Rudaea sp.]|uniref:hypothetical protein n=1 Tax=Rudaea sp. TaxID=2136325 RepID=UPI002ED62B63